MAATVRFEGRVEIPLDIRSLDDFRRWATSDGFPETGRIDYLDGCIEVDMSPEDIFCHGVLKLELVGVLHPRIKRLGLGHLLTDRSRVSCPQGDLSVEPDVVFISHEALDAGRLRLVPKAGGEPGRYIEIEGPPDLVVEIVSDSSVRKDTQRLPGAYFAAGVSELWLADARGDAVTFRIHRRGPETFEAVAEDGEGFQVSAVLGAAFRLNAHRDRRGHWAFDLHVREG